MDKNFGDTWTEVDNLIAEVVEIYKTSLQDVSKLKAAAAEGAAQKCREILNTLQSSINLLRDRLNSPMNFPVGDPKLRSVLQGCVEELCTLQGLSTDIFSSGHYLVVFPVVVNFDEINNKVVTKIGANRFRSTRPDFIVRKVSESLAAPFDKSQFTKSLKTAWQLLLKNERQSEVSLEDIRKAISVTSESVSSYSQDQFTADLQRLFEYESDDARNQLPRLTPVAAASRQYLLFKRNGSSTNYGALSFDQNKTE